MSDTTTASDLSRRGFLKAASLALTTGSLLTIPGSRLLLARSGEPVLRVGLLLPESRLYPDLAARLLDGMRLALVRDPVSTVSFTLLPMVYGTSPMRARAVARDLIAGGQVALLAGMVSREILGPLEHLLRARDTPMLVTDVGANVARTKASSPYLWRNSLGFWQASWALGAWAAQHVGRRAALVASFYESGYDALYAFRAGFERAGGSIVESRVTHVPPRQGDDLRAALRAAAAAQPDLIYAAYSGPAATEFMRAYADSGLAGHVRLLGSSLLGDATPAGAGSAAVAGMLTCAPWASCLATPTNRAFLADYRALAGRDADSLALLGYDTGLILRSVSEQLEGGRPRAEQLLGALDGAVMASPRGPLSFSAATRETVGPLYLREARWNGESLQQTILTSLAPVDAIDETAATLRAGIKTGWWNTYLCA